MASVNWEMKSVTSVWLSCGVGLARVSAILCSYLLIWPSESKRGTEFFPISFIYSDMLGLIRAPKGREWRIHDWLAISYGIDLSRSRPLAVFVKWLQLLQRMS